MREDLVDDFPLNDANSILNRVPRLVRGMPEDQATNSALESLRKEGKELAKAQNDGWVALNNAGHNKKQPPDSISLGALQRQIGDYRTHKLRWSAKVDTFERGILQRASEKRDTAERRYKIFTYFSYVLYGIGWSLPLLGKLYGVGAEPQRE